MHGSNKDVSKGHLGGNMSISAPSSGISAGVESLLCT